MTRTTRLMQNLRMSKSEKNTYSLEKKLIKISHCRNRKREHATAPEEFQTVGSITVVPKLPLAGRL